MKGMTGGKPGLNRIRRFICPVLGLCTFFIAQSLYTAPAAYWSLDETTVLTAADHLMGFGLNGAMEKAHFTNHLDGKC